MPRHPDSTTHLASEDPFDLGGVTIADKYRIDELVGSGGFGVVYRGEHLGFEEPIAIKCLKLPGELTEDERATFLARLQEEGRVLHRLSKQTSGIVQALDVGAVVTPRGTWVPYLVLEWLEGKTLADLLAERRRSGRARFTLDEAIEFLQPAADALAVAHRQKVAHRDVKPENIFVTEVDGRRTVKVLDFGIAKVLTHHANFASMATQKNASAFTPSYGAPEQFNKKRGATGPWTDVFALALIVVELVTGERALDGDDATQLYIASADPASRPTPRHHGVSTSDAVDDVFALALAVDPAERYGDAGTFWGALREAAGKATPRDVPAADVSDTGEFVHRSGIDLDAELDRAADAATVLRTPARGRTARAAAADDTVPDPTTSEPRADGLTARATDVAEEPRRERGRAIAGGRASEHDETGRGDWGGGADASAKRGGLPVVPFLVGLSLAGAGALTWQLTSVGVTRTPRPHPTASATARPVSPKAANSVLTLPSPSASASAAPSASASAAPSGAGGHGGGGNVDGAGGSAAPTPKEPPPGMVRVTSSDGKTSFFIDRTEVSTKAYLECVMAGRCKKATRVVLTEESARALGVPDVNDAMAPEQLAAAWEKRCNQTRNASDNPINCVNFGSAEDYCGFRNKRLPTSSEWTLAAARETTRKHPWGDDRPECGFACFGLNGTCVGGTTEVASCAIGSRRRDATADGIVDLAANVAEWVSDESAKAHSDGPRWRMIRGGSFLDEAAGLDLGQERALPPVTAYVSVGFRCALSE